MLAIHLRALHDFRQHGAGNLQQTVSEEEYSRAEAEHFVGKLQLPRHLQPGEADVHAIEVRGDVQQEQKGNQPPRDLSVYTEARCIEGGSHGQTQ